MQFPPTELKSSPAWEKQTKKTQSTPWEEEAEEEIYISLSWVRGFFRQGITGKECLCDCLVFYMPRAHQ